jgi:hypothetical protein
LPLPGQQERPAGTRTERDAQKKLNLLHGLFFVYCSYLKEKDEDERIFLLLAIALTLRVIFMTFPAVSHPHPEP